MIHTNTDSSASGLGNRTHSRFELIVDYLEMLFERLHILKARCAGDVLERLAFSSRELESSVRHLLARGANTTKNSEGGLERRPSIYEEAKKYLESGLLRGPHGFR